MIWPCLTTGEATDKKQVALIAMLVQQALFTQANGDLDNKGRFTNNK